MIKYLFSIFILFFLVISCENNSNIEDKKVHTKKKEIKPVKKTTHRDFKYDSLVIQKAENIELDLYSLSDSFYILSSNSIKALKPYFTDSIIKHYSCCPEYITGYMFAYLNGKKMYRYTLTNRGGAFGKMEIDSGYTFFVPPGYQYRIRIPADFWKKIINDSKKIKINAE